MKIAHNKTVAWALVFLLSTCHLLPSLAYGDENEPPKLDKSYKLSIAVRARTDGASDKLSRDIAAAVREALPHIIPAHMISPNIMDNVLSYYQKETTRLTPKGESAAENLTHAKQHYFGFQYDIALAEVKRAIDILRQGKISKNGAMLQDALLTQGIIAKANGNNELAQESFTEVATLNPFYEINPVSFPPSTVKMYKNSYFRIMKKEKGSLKIESNPQSAEIYINGILQGVTPLDLNQIPSGTYSVLIKTNKYQPIEERIEIVGGKKVVVRKNLRWVSGQKTARKKSRRESAREEINEGIRTANLLKADKAILIDCDESKGSKIIYARMVDRKYRAAYKPLVAIYETPEQRAQAVTDITYALAGQAKANILNDPMKHLDNEGIGDPVLLGKRKKKIYKRPLFWGAIGTVVAGAVAGGMVAALSGGSSSDAGSLAVQFK